MSTEIFASSPLWLELSGLPLKIAEECKSPVAWFLFKKIMELDIAKNSLPGIVEISIADLSQRTAIPEATCTKILESLRKKKRITLFLPDNHEEEALIRIQVPIETPLSIEEIKDSLMGEAIAHQSKFRYSIDYDMTLPGDDDSDSPSPVLQEVVDLYFDTVGMKMNAFILDELRIISDKFPIDTIRKTFRRARQNEIHSLHWVVSELMKLAKKTD